MTKNAPSHAETRPRRRLGFCWFGYRTSSFAFRSFGLSTFLCNLRTARWVWVEHRVRHRRGREYWQHCCQKSKRECEHSDWLQWLEDNFGWSVQTATNYMNVAHAFGQIPKPLEFENVSITSEALYLLAKPSVPVDVRDEAIEKAEHATDYDRLLP